MNRLATVMKREFYKLATPSDKHRIYIRAIRDTIISTILTTKGLLSFLAVKSVFVELPVLLLFFWGYFSAFELVHIAYLGRVEK
jgi:hypothetical protein